jgi:tetratricopeptide (TPR) repeat protein
MELIITEKVDILPNNINPSICLNMIVKNESHIIKDTLEKLCSKIQFSYWVICDTGSTDNTREIISDFFNSKSIPGELYQDEWKNFAHNRTLALERAYFKTELLLVFDADDEIVGDIQMPKIGDKKYDEYHLKFGSPTGTAYTRVLLINNKKKFKYSSVIHEFISCLEPNPTNKVIEGNYYVISGRAGNRNKDPQKYLKDAKILEEAYAEAISVNDPLYHRYSFYCANSYKDYGSFEDAIKWYKITLSQDNWEQEQYVSCLYIYECYEKLKQMETGLFYLVKAFRYDSERVECLYPLLVHYCCEKQNHIAYSYYLNIKDFFENDYLNSNMEKKLFVVLDKYNFFVPYYMILIADKVHDYDCVIRMFEIIFTKKMPIHDTWYIKNLLYNLQFFIQHLKADNKDQFISLTNQYFKFLCDLGIPMNTFDYLKDYDIRFGIDVSYIFYKPVTNKPTIFSKEECVNSNNLLFYTGFADINWNYSYMKNNALGGSEKAVAYLSKEMASLLLSKNYTVYVAGSVQNEVFDNVFYVNHKDISDLIKSTPFHTVIVSRYISFYEMFKECSYYQSYIWAHDTHLLPYGCNLTEAEIITKWDKYIDGCICLTEWHKELFIFKYPEFKNKITLINNGIDIVSFTKSSINKKQLNKFIYSSRPERGLNVLLELWSQIIEILPDSELVISNYGIDPEPELMNIIKKHNTIKYLGKLNTEELYEEMDTAEYWLYPTSWPETSCITALEMLMSKVICLYYPVAGLPYTINNNGIQIQTGEEIEAFVNLTVKNKQQLKENGKKYAETCSWKNRAESWYNLLFQNVKCNEKWLFIIPTWFMYGGLHDYFDNMKTKYDLEYTNDTNMIYSYYPTKITFVYEINDKILEHCKNNNIEISLLNTEPLTINERLQCTIMNAKKMSNMKIYDYSKSNIKILNTHGFNNTEYLPYIITEEENLFLKDINKNTEKIYDYGIISPDNPITCIRRANVVKFLIENGYKVKIIGNLWKEARDKELAKCRIILNIHGQYLNTRSNIFEHLRCDRLLEAGYQILSEDSYSLDPAYIEKYKENLKIIKYTDFFNLKIHEKIAGKTTGFIILRYVNSELTNKYWQYCYDCIRRFYPENLILIIDDNSNYNYVTNKELYKTTVINSEYPQRGEVLPYYYYLKNKLFDTACIIHDSVFINKYIDLTVDKYKLIWDFPNKWINTLEDEINIIKLFNDDELCNFHKNRIAWRGCFGGMSIITHDFLTHINSKYDLTILLNVILTRHNRCSFERVIGCLLQKEYKLSVLLGDIITYCKWEIKFDEKDNYKHLPVIKIWHGR